MKRINKLTAVLTASLIMVVTGLLRAVPAEATAYAPKSSVKTGFVMVGDSRTARMRSEISSADSAQSSWSCLAGSQFAWFSTTGISDAEKLITPGCRVIIMMGVNDLYKGIPAAVENYSTLINTKAKQWASSWGVKTYFVSVNPVDEANLQANTTNPEWKSRYTNAMIETFNAAIKAKLSSDVTYINAYPYVAKIADLPDGLHYSAECSRKIYAWLRAWVLKNAGSYTAPKASDITVSGLVNPVKYEGKAVTQSGLTLTYKGKKLTKGLDYTLSYANNNKAGVASVKITFTGNYSGSVTKYFDITPASTQQTVQLYQFFNAKTHDHFYTIDTTERDSLIALYKAKKGNYQYMGTSGTVETSATSTNTPVYRFYNSTKNDHFYTTDLQERNQIIAKYNAGTMKYKYEGIAWYAKKSSSKPMYRFFSSKWQDHYYTVSSSERNQIIAKYKAGRITYAYEKIAWYY